MISPRIIQMLTKTGFVSLFWSDLATARHTKPTITHRDVYEAMETEYITATGQRRYSSFESFKQRRDK